MASSVLLPLMGFAWSSLYFRLIKTLTAIYKKSLLFLATWMIQWSLSRTQPHKDKPVFFYFREVQGVPDTVPEGGVAPPPLDSAWAESTRKKALLKLEKLDTDLKNYKGNSIKESIRYYIIRIIFLFSNTVLTHICKNSSHLLGFWDLNAGFTLDVEPLQTALFRRPC